MAGLSSCNNESANRNEILSLVDWCCRYTLDLNISSEQQSVPSVAVPQCFLVFPLPCVPSAPLSVCFCSCVSVGVVLPSSLSWFTAQSLLPICTTITSFPSPELPHPPAHLCQVQFVRHSLYIPVMLLCSLLDCQFSFVCNLPCAPVFLSFPVPLPACLPVPASKLLFSIKHSTASFCLPQCPALGSTLHQHCNTISYQRHQRHKRLFFLHLLKRFGVSRDGIL